MPVHPSTKSFLDFSDIWYLGSGRRVMHDSSDAKTGFFSQPIIGLPKPVSYR